MQFVAGIFIGSFIGIMLMACVSAHRITESENERYNTEKRALTHFRKLQEIERIIKQDEIRKEFSMFTLNKIKEAINDRKSN